MDSPELKPRLLIFRRPCLAFKIGRYNDRAFDNEFQLLPAFAYPCCRNHAQASVADCSTSRVR